MTMWDEFIAGIHEEELKQFIKDYEVFSANGAIGDCLLRTRAEEWMAKIGGYGSVVFAMRDLTFAAYKHFADKYFDLRKSMGLEVNGGKVFAANGRSLKDLLENAFHSNGLVGVRLRNNQAYQIRNSKKEQCYRNVAGNIAWSYEGKCLNYGKGAYEFDIVELAD